MDEHKFKEKELDLEIEYSRQGKSAERQKGRST